MGKTVEQWFLEAKEQGCEWVDEALENAQNADIGCGLGVIELSLSEALAGAFSWSRSPEGHPYWDGVYCNLTDQGK